MAFPTENKNVYLPYNIVNTTVVHCDMFVEPYYLCHQQPELTVKCFCHLCCSVC